ncbi:MAG: hypothetical protein KDD67_05860 [Ignavibacteriae bacterium]|nr:hypothetical protein [Ignavibacteriota bacterium]MCB9217509.1 hypothetical protein [Ignavibacteria bacterium]
MAENTEYKRRRVRWSFGATIIALALWGILSMSQTYSWDIYIPLEVRIDTTKETLAESVPRTIRITARADGWTLMQVALSGDARCLLTPSGTPTSSSDSLRAYTYSERDLLTSINISSAVQLEDVRPRGLRVSVTRLASKRVPLYYPEFSIDTRSGFQVIGSPRLSPDSVTISGPPEKLKEITHWYTTPLNLDDVFKPVLTTVPVSDTLYGVVSIYPDVAMVNADVQEVAEVTFENLPIVNRGRLIDTTTQIHLYPQRVTVTLRGGAEELGKLSEADIVPYIQLTLNVDTSGFARPQISLPSRGNATVIAVTPERIRFVWRKVLPTTGSK